MRVTKKDIGKDITFKIGACTWTPRKETRILRDVQNGYAVVRYAGSENFYVKPAEIISIKRRK